MAYLGRVKPTETTSSVLRSTYTGNGSTTTYALPGPVANETSIIATINGVTQQDAAYSTDGSNIIFVAAPALGDSIEIRTLSAVAMSYAPSAGSVVTGIIADGAVTTAKINDASVTGAKLGTGAAVANIGARAITAGQMPAGTVLQVVQGKLSTSFSVANTGQNDTGLTATITPTSNTSKILCYVTLNGIRTNNTTYNTYIYLLRNGVNLDGVGTFSSFFNYFATTQLNGRVGTVTNMVLDSPATTSACTYKIQFACESASSTSYLNDQNTMLTPSTIILMEIAQ
jgi:hypothetical protein